METSNLESQYEEIQVLREILQDSFEAQIPISTVIPVSGSSFGEPISGGIKISVRIPEQGFQCSYQKTIINAATSSDTEVKLSKQNRETMILNRLPPLVLRFTLYWSYPSDSIPEFHLNCAWLGEKELSKLSLNLKELWDQNYGSPILYTWYLFLVESLEWLEIGTQSSPYDLESASLFDGQTFFEDLEDHLIEYEKMQVLAEFDMAYNECPICCLSKAGSNSVKLDCGHIFCKSCVEEFCTMHIQQGTLEALKCLESECDQVVGPSEVAKLVPPDIFERYDQLLLSRALDHMADVLHCPRSLCAKAVVFEPADQYAKCSFCGFAFCIECTRAYHGVKPCKNDEEAQAETELVKEYQNATTEEQREFERNHGKKRMRDLVAQVLSEDWIKYRSKFCPGCQVPIERNNGCNHMCCAHCGLYFCWGCLKPLDGHRDDPTKACASTVGAELPEVEVTHTFEAWDLSAEIDADGEEEDKLREELADIQDYERRRVSKLKGIKVETAEGQY